VVSFGALSFEHTSTESNPIYFSKVWEGSVPIQMKFRAKPPKKVDIPLQRLSEVRKRRSNLKSDLVRELLYREAILLEMLRCRLKQVRNGNARVGGICRSKEFRGRIPSSLHRSANSRRLTHIKSSPLQFSKSL